MREDLKSKFQKYLENAILDFEGKMEQNQLFQLQERLAEQIISEVKNDRDYDKDKIKTLEVYEQNALKLKASGKSYKSVLEEKIFTDGYRIFEEFLAKIFKSIFTVFPYLLLEGKKEQKEITVPFDYIFTSPNIDGSKNLVIENKVKSYLQGDNIMKILDRFNTTFHLKVSISNEQKLACQKMALLRNVIIHNNSKINEIYLRGVQMFDIPNNHYKIEESVLSNLENEINEQRQVFGKLTLQIIKDLESDGNIKSLNNRNDKLAN